MFFLRFLNWYPKMLGATAVNTFLYNTLIWLCVIKTHDLIWIQIYRFWPVWWRMWSIRLMGACSLTTAGSRMRENYISYLLSQNCINVNIQLCTVSQSYHMNKRFIKWLLLSIWLTIRCSSRWASSKCK